MSTCINPHAPEFIELKEALQSESAARAATALNSDVIPDIETAKALLNATLLVEEDTRIKKSSDAFTLKKMQEEHLQLEILKAKSTTKKQRAAIQSLQNASFAFQKELERNIKLGIPTNKNSVTNLIGSNFTGDPAEFEHTKRFGIFMHDLADKVIKISNTENKRISDIIASEDFFTTELTNFYKKNYFDIGNLNDEQMHEMAKDLVEKIAGLKGTEHILIPEMTIVGKGRTAGSYIIGRVDLMTINKEGKFKVYDFKTKKVTDLLGKKEPVTGEIIESDNTSYVIGSLADREYATVLPKDVQNTKASVPILEATHYKRSVYDTWAVQLQLYENILIQSGVQKDSDSVIIGLLYEMDKENTTVLARAIHVFDKQQYYEYASEIKAAPTSTSTLQSANAKINRLKKAVEFEIPTKKEEEIEEEKEMKNLLEFVPSSEEDRMLLDMVHKMYESQIGIINKKIKEAKAKNASPSLLRIYEGELNTIMAFKNTYDQIESDTDLRLMHNFHIIHGLVREELNNLSNESSKAIGNFRNNRNDRVNFLKQSKIVSTSYERARTLRQITDILKDILRGAMDSPNNMLTNDSEIMRSVNTMTNNIESINSMFAEVSLESSVEILASIPEKTYERIAELSKEPIDLQIIHLEKQLEGLKQGKSASFMQGIKNALLINTSSVYKRELRERLSDPEKYMMDEIESIEFKILSLRGQQTQKYDADSLRKYINSVTIPESTRYIGAQSIMQPNGVLSNTLMDQFIASAGNADHMIAAFTMNLKNSKIAGTQNLQQAFGVIQFDQVKSKLLEKYTLKEINEAISEKRTAKVRNPKTLQDEDKTATYFTKVTSQAYEDIYKNFESESAALNADIRNLKAGFKHLRPGTQEYLDAKDAYTSKIEERNKFTEDYVQWRVDHMHLPYSDEFYNLQKLLPFDIRNELQKKYHEIEIIKASLDAAEEFLTDEDAERLDNIEQELRELKAEARLQNPDYEKYINLFNQIYRFDVNEGKYERAYNNAKIKYEIDDPVTWQKWLDKNTTVKPRDEWYQTLNDLYDEKNFILSYYYGSDPEIQDLLDYKKELLAPHKVLGELRIKHLDENTIAELDHIQQRIDDIIEASSKKKKPKMAKEDAQALTEITAEIDAISEKKIVKDYEKQFNNKSKNLRNKYSNYITASVAYQLEKDGATPQRLAELQNNVVKLENDFLLYEQEFKTWYENFHINNYRSITVDLNNFKNNKIPKEFNYQRVVAEGARSQYMEEKPSAKYRVKSIREDEYYDVATGEELTPEYIETLAPGELEQLVATGAVEFKKGAHNPNFLKSEDGIPMPKNVYKENGVYKVIPGQETFQVSDPKTGETHNAVNEKYLDMMYNKPDIFSFYNTMMNMYFKAQNAVDGRRTGYLVPGYGASLIENLSTLGLAATAAKQMDTFIDKSVKAQGSHHDHIENSYGELGDIIRLTGANQLPENLQTTDSLGALMQYMAEAHYNIAVQEVAPVADMTIQHLESLSETIAKKILANDNTYVDPVSGKTKRVDWNRRKQELDNVVNILKFERRKFVNGQGSNPNEKRRLLTKRVKQIMSYTSFLRMGFEVAGQTKNYFSGNVQAFLAAGGLDDSSHYTREDYFWAKKQLYTEFLPNYFRDWGKINDVSESTLLYRLYNPLQKEFDKYLAESSGGTSRRVLGKLTNPVELAYMIQDKGDTEIGVTVMYSVLNNYRYKVIESYDAAGNPVFKKDAAGNYETVRGHEVYYKDANNTLQISKDVHFTADDEKFIRNIIYSEMRRAQGNYASWDQTKFEENIIGKMMFYYRKYVIPQFLNRFGYLRPNWEGAEVAVGYWRAMGNLYNAYGFKDTLLYFIGLGKVTKAMSPAAIGKVYTKSVNHARRDLLVSGMLTVLSLMALQYVKRKDDDDEELGMMEGNLIRVLWGVKGETVSMMPIGAGSSDYIRTFASLTTFTKEITTIKNFVGHGWNTGYVMLVAGGEEPDPEYDSIYYQEAWKDAFYSRRAGAYEAGDMKLAKDFADLTPAFKNIRDLFDPNFRIDLLKRNQ